MIEEVFRIIHEQTRKPAEDIVRRVLRDGQVANLANHTALVTRDGREIPIEDSAAPIRNNAGEVAGVVIVFHDVTAKRIAQEAMELAHAEAVSEKNRLEAVMEALPFGVAILDPQGGNVRSNAMFDQIWGSPRPVARSIGDYDAYRAWWVDTGQPGQPGQPEEWASARSVQRDETLAGQLM